MREYKFRVRNAETKEIVAYELLGINYNMGYAFYFANDPEEKLHTDSNELVRVCGILSPIREQFTGLKDKNGKEIYEGDILKVYYSVMDNKLSEVEFGRGIFFIMKNKEYYPLSEFIYNYKNETTYLEVMGNIYENPELIGK